jgi:hypothetical protein
MSHQNLTMGMVPVSKMEVHSTLMQLTAREDFAAFICHASFKSPKTGKSYPLK